MLGKIEGKKEKEAAEEEMARQHYCRWTWIWANCRRLWRTERPVCCGQWAHSQMRLSSWATFREKSWQSGKQATLMLTDFNSCIRSLEFSRIMEAADNIWYRGKSNVTSDMSSISGVKKELDFPEAMTPALGLCQHCLCRKSSLISSQMGLFD